MNKIRLSIPTIGYASGLAAGDHGCAMGPIILQDSPVLEPIAVNLNWLDMLYAHQSEEKLAAIPAVVEICERLAYLIQDLVQQKEKFLVIGGDHSSAIGTWSGVAAALHKINKNNNLGLIWFDAHMDSHTPQTTPSGNIHGMPVASLLGYGDDRLSQLLTQQTKIKPEHICLLGVRSYETDEAALLQKLGVRIFFMEEIKERGLAAVTTEAINRVNNNTAGFGVSLDLDAIDPFHAPGVGAPAPDGITSNELLATLGDLKNHPHLLGLEIAEFNPNHDKNNKTEKLIANIIQSAF